MSPSFYDMLSNNEYFCTMKDNSMARISEMMNKYISIDNRVPVDILANKLYKLICAELYDGTTVSSTLKGGNMTKFLTVSDGGDDLHPYDQEQDVILSTMLKEIINKFLVEFSK
jgi:hypothetical protein